MQKQTLDIISQTIVFWRERSGQEFSQEEARAMVSNVLGFFNVLVEWERRAAEDTVHRK